MVTNPAPTRLPSHLMAYLPAIYQTDPIIGQFLLSFEKILLGIEDEMPFPRVEGAVEFESKGLEQEIAGISAYFDPQKTPVEFLPWLASWVALTLRANWKPEQQRDFLAQIVSCYQYRGTKDNLIKLLKIYTGLEPTITEAGPPFQLSKHSTLSTDTYINGGPPYYFKISVTLPNPSSEILERQRQIVGALVDLQKPAQTDYDLQISFDTIQIHQRSTIGKDTLLGTLAQSTSPIEPPLLEPQ